VSEALLSDTIYNGKRVTLGDIFLKSTGWKTSWKNKPQLKDFSFPLNANRESLTRLQDSVLTLIYTRITKKDLVISKPDRKLAFISVELSSFNELFSKLFTERLMRSAGDFYIQTKTYRSQINVANLQEQADSILAMLNNTMFAEARTQDLNLDPVKHIGLLATESLTRDKTILVTAYSEVIRNLGVAKMTLAQETPVIQVVDEPLFPLRVDKPHKVIDVLVGFVAAGFMAMVFLLFARFYRQYAPTEVHGTQA